MSPLRIAIVVHGRFHAFDLARALGERGHEVVVFTNYPAWAAARFGLQPRQVRSFVAHGAMVRALGKLSAITRWPVPDPLPHRLFGAWAARAVARERWDVIHPFSGVAEELLQTPALAATPKLLLRGSAHIRTQDRLLAEEGQRAGAIVARPSPWMIAREEREYRLADGIVVLSSFARNSFLAEGIPAERLAVLPLGVDTSSFRPDPAAIAERRRRILAGEPLRLLYTGALSLQKGMWDMAAIAEALDPDRFQLTLVGANGQDVGPLLPRLQARATLVPSQPQQRLPNFYAQSDLFVFPTVQDGYAMVLAQAQAAGLPVLTTTNCAGPDMLREGATGWVLPIRSPAAFVQRLRWCDEHRPELAAIVQQCYEHFRPRNWAAVADDFVQICRDQPRAARARSYVPQH